MRYLETAEFRLRSIAPPELLDAIEETAPGWIETQLTAESGKMNARLAKRYAAPFSTPYPDVVLGWLTDIITHRCYLRRGLDPTDRQSEDIRGMAEQAQKDVIEAANSSDGLFELPLRQDTTASGIAKGGPLGYSEDSPYVWTDLQAEKARNEDFNGTGTRG